MEDRNIGDEIISSMQEAVKFKRRENVQFLNLDNISMDEEYRPVEYFNLRLSYGQLQLLYNIVDSARNERYECSLAAQDLQKLILARLNSIKL